MIVCDVLDDFFDCFAERSGERVARLLERLLRWRLRRPLNALVERAMGRDPASAWALRHGLHVSGAGDPYEFIGWLKSLSTAPFSHRITQDFLLLAGAEDHIVPRRRSAGTASTDGDVHAGPCDRVFGMRLGSSCVPVLRGWRSPSALHSIG